MIKVNEEFIKANHTLFYHKKCVIVVGAGISIASGVPDFNLADRNFSSVCKEHNFYGKELFTHNFGIKEGNKKLYLQDVSSLKTLCDKAKHNKIHSFLSTFPRTRIYTQNIDGLEEKAGVIFSKNENTKLIYLQGSLATVICTYCGFKKSFDDYEITSYYNSVDVICPECQKRRENCYNNSSSKTEIGIMHPNLVHYQQIHPDRAFIDKISAKDIDCDLLIVLGTSLTVDRVKKIVKSFCRGPNSKGKRIFVNNTKPKKEWEDYFDYFFQGDCNDFVDAVETHKTKLACVTVKNIVNNRLSTTITKNENKMFETAQVDNTTDQHHNLMPVYEGEIHFISDKAYKKEIWYAHSDNTPYTHNIGMKLKRLSLSKETEQKSCIFENKLKILTKSFSDEETIDSSVLDDALRNSTQTAIDQSFCSDLQSEIDLIVKDRSQRKN